MALSKEVREACLARLADELLGLNPRFVAYCSQFGVPVPMPGTGAQSGMPFNFTANRSPNVMQTRALIDQVEEQSLLQYPCLLISSTGSRMDATKKMLGALFFGRIVVEMRVYISWVIQQPPPNNNFEIQLDALQHAMYDVFNGGVNEFNQPAMWPPGIVYDGDISEINREPMQLHNAKQNWRRGTLFQATFLAIE